MTGWTCAGVCCIWVSICLCFDASVFLEGYLGPFDACSWHKSHSQAWDGEFILHAIYLWVHDSWPHFSFVLLCLFFGLGICTHSSYSCLSFVLPNDKHLVWLKSLSQHGRCCPQLPCVCSPTAQISDIEEIIIVS